MDGALGKAGEHEARVYAILDTLRVEIEGTAEEASVYRQQRDEYERKLEAHLQELNMLHGALAELERVHVNMTTTYEAEILSLRQQIEAAGGKVAQSQAGATAVAPAPTIPPDLVGAPAASSSSLLLGGADTKSVLGGAAAAVAAGIPQGLLPMGLGMMGGGEAGTVMAGGLGGGGVGEMAMAEAAGGLLLAARAANAATGAGAAPGDAANLKPLDSRGAPMEDWNIVVNSAGGQAVKVKQELVLQHDSVVCCVRFSADGRYFATGCNKTAALYDVVSGQRVCMFVNDQVVEGNAAEAAAAAGGGDSYVRSVCFSPDSRLLVAGTEDRTIKVWDLTSRRLRHSLTGHGKNIYSVDCTSDCRLIASGSGDRTAKLWDVRTGVCVRTFGDESGPLDGVTSVAVSPDGRFLAAGSLDKTVRIWDTETGALADRFNGHEDSVYSVSFSPDGSLLATGSLDKTVRLWDISQVGKRSGGETAPRFTFKGHKDFVLSVAFAPQGNWLLSGSKDRSVNFWDTRMLLDRSKTEDGPSVILQGHQNSVISLAHSPLGNLFASGSGDKCARIWRYTTE